MSCTGRFWLVAGSCAITGNRRSEQASRSPQIGRRQRCTITTNKGKGWSWGFGGRVEMGTAVGVIRFNRRIVSRKTGVTGDNARNFRFRIGIIARLIGLLVTFGGGWEWDWVGVRQRIEARGFWQRVHFFVSRVFAPARRATRRSRFISRVTQPAVGTLI